MKEESLNESFKTDDENICEEETYACKAMREWRRELLIEGFVEGFIEAFVESFTKDFVNRFPVKSFVSNLVEAGRKDEQEEMLLCVKQMKAGKKEEDLIAEGFEEKLVQALFTLRYGEM